jgi:hypothetical protein
MSDRMYLHACPTAEAGKVTELLDTPPTLPFQPYVEDGVLYTSGTAPSNPRWNELMDWIHEQPYTYVVKWPAGHLARLFWKWSKLSAEDYDWKTAYMEGADRGITPACPPEAAVPLLQKQLQRAVRAEEINAERATEVEAFVAEHPNNYLFLVIA